MSFLLCPLCGKNSSLRYLDPDSFEDDILAQDVVGLGPGQGFKTTGRHSILHSGEVKAIIAPRLLVLVKLMIDEGVLSTDEVTRRLGLPRVEVIVEREGDETQALREEREVTEERLKRIVAGMAEALEESPDDIEEDVVSELEHFVERMIDELGAAIDSEDQSTAERIDAITEEVANALGQSAGDFTPEGDEEDTPVGKLVHYARQMLDEFTALKENQEGHW
jgi:polyhydroxyalkanoate synthesis regulator phasin